MEQALYTFAGVIVGVGVGLLVRKLVERCSDGGTHDWVRVSNRVKQCVKCHTRRRCLSSMPYPKEPPEIIEKQ